MAELSKECERFADRLVQDALESFARDLVVAPRALSALRCGIATRVDMERLNVGFGKGAMPDEALTFPERNAQSETIGVCFRARDGRKGTARGSNRGLIFADAEAFAGPRILTEGASDTAAGLSLCLSCIGRASSVAGGALLETFVRLRAEESLVLADSDGAGEKGARALAKRLANAWQRPVRWTTLPPGYKDLRAYLIASGVDLNDEERCAEVGERLLAILIERAKVEQPQTLTRCIADIPVETMQWTIPGVIPQGKLSLLAGNPGLGKTLVALDLVARFTRGEGMPGQSAPDAPGEALFLSAEDDPADTLRPRLEAAGAVLERVHVSGCLDLAELLKMLEERPNVRLVVIDPLAAYTGHVETHRDADVRSFLAPFVELARERKVAILCIVHLRKTGDGPAIFRPGGSIGIVAAARIAWVVVKDPHDEQRRLLLPLKNNLGPDAQGWGYRVESSGTGCAPRAAWEVDRVSITPDELQAQERRAASTSRNGRANAIEDAADFLQEILKAGSCPASHVLDAGKAEGHSFASLRRAKVALGVVVDKTGMHDGWTWALPMDAGQVGARSICAEDEQDLEHGAE